jgi:hypothetical protein
VSYEFELCRDPECTYNVNHPSLTYQCLELDVPIPTNIPQNVLTPVSNEEGVKIIGSDFPISDQVVTIITVTITMLENLDQYPTFFTYVTRNVGTLQETSILLQTCWEVKFENSNINMRTQCSLKCINIGSMQTKISDHVK